MCAAVSLSEQPVRAALAELGIIAVRKLIADSVKCNNLIFHQCADKRRYANTYSRLQSSLTLFRHSFFEAFLQTAVLASITRDLVNLTIRVFLTRVLDILLHASSKKALQRKQKPVVRTRIIGARIQALKTRP
jgi:hypothetical protein